MFIPSSSVEDTHHESLQERAERESRAEPKRVIYQNTRMHDHDTEEQQQQQHNIPPPSPSMSAIEDAIAGRPRLGSSEIISTSGGGETPRVNGYSFVGNDDDEEEESEAGPENLSVVLGSSSEPNPFHIGNMRRREDLHHRMVDRMARTRRAEKTAQDAKKPVPKFPSSPALDFGLRRGNANGKTFTPAAHRLLQKVGSTPAGKEEASSSLRNMWTPRQKKKK